MINIPEEIARIEAWARERNFPIRELCREAETAVSNWARWKSRKTSPTIANWSKVEAAVERHSQR